MKFMGFMLLAILTAGTVRANGSMSSVDGSSTAVPQACQDNSTGTCVSPPARQTSGEARPPERAAWQAELEKAQTAWNACHKEIDQFCEGVQVGEGRLESCLKAHVKKLSPACKKAQGLK
jgi:hypothetical protein